MPNERKTFALKPGSGLPRSPAPGSVVRSDLDDVLEPHLCPLQLWKENGSIAEV